MATGFNVNSNISSMKTYRAFAHSQTKLEESIERLSTGLRINKASDDTEGAAIATRLSNRVRSLQKAQTNYELAIQICNNNPTLNASKFINKQREIYHHVHYGKMTLTEANTTEKCPYYETAPSTGDHLA